MSPLEQLGEYKILKVLGRGGMGVVYRGRQESLDRDVAIKVLPSDLTQNPDFITRFYREAKAAARIIHPNVIQIYTIGKEGNTHYFAMEFVGGEDLDAKIRRQEVFSMSRIVEIIQGVCLALAAAGNRGIVHRDIKPANIMIGQDNEIKVMDFGLAKAASSSTQVTQAGIIVGTVNYMSPEQGQGEKLDHRSDIYSLGIVMYELITGRVPFKGDRPASVIYMHINKEPVQPREINQSIPEELERICLKAIGKHPDDRYDDASDMWRDLGQFKESSLYVTIADSVYAMPSSKGEGPDRTPTDVRHEMSKKERHHKPTRKEIRAKPAPAAASQKKSKLVPVLIGIICLLVAGGGGFWWWNNQQKSKPQLVTSVPVAQAPAAVVEEQQQTPPPASPETLKFRVFFTDLKTENFPQGTVVSLDDKRLGLLPYRQQTVLKGGRHILAFAYHYETRKVAIEIKQGAFIPDLSDLAFESSMMSNPEYAVSRFQSDVEGNFKAKNLNEASRLLNMVKGGLPHNHAVWQSLKKQFDLTSAKKAYEEAAYQDVLKVLAGSPVGKEGEGKDLVGLADAQIAYKSGNIENALNAVKDVHSSEATNFKRLAEGKKAINNKQWLQAHQKLTGLDYGNAPELLKELSAAAQIDLMEQAQQALRKGEFNIAERHLSELDSVAVSTDTQSITLRAKIISARNLYNTVIERKEDQDLAHSIVTLEQLQVMTPDFLMANQLLENYKKELENQKKKALEDQQAAVAQPIGTTSTPVISIPKPVSPTKDELISRAKQFFLDGRYAEARMACEEMLKTYPGDTEILHLQKTIHLTEVRNLLNEGKVDLAMTKCDALILSYKDDAAVFKLMLDIYLVRIESMMQEKNWQEAAAAIEKVETHIIPQSGPSDKLDEFKTTVTLVEDLAAFEGLVKDGEYMKALEMLETKTLASRTRDDSDFSARVATLKDEALRGKWQAEVGQLVGQINQSLLEKNAEKLLGLFQNIPKKDHALLARQVSAFFKERVLFRDTSTFEVSDLQFDMEQKSASGSLQWQYALDLEEVKRVVEGKALLRVDLKRDDKNDAWQVLNILPEDKK